MRYLLGFLTLFALGLVLLMQCGEADLCEDVDCNDDNRCTEDVCNPVDGSCSHTALTDGTACTLNGDRGQCMAGVCVGLCEGVDCDDGNPCTEDVCSAVDGTCSNPAAPDGTACPFGEYPGQCSSGVCVGLCEGVECNDDNQCTEDVCNPADGSCSNINRPDGAQCDFDRLPGVCRSGVCEDAELCREVDCSDDNDCTEDVCDPMDGSCSNPNKVDGAVCDIDDNPGRCTDGRCVGLCEGVDCSDGNECTIDTCDPSNGSCPNPPVEDGTECDFGGRPGVCATGVCVSVCALGLCDDENECTEDLCDIHDGSCTNEPVPDQTRCDLNGRAGVCEAGVCVGQLISVDDPVFGPDSITRDTNTGLEWLDLTHSTDRSFDDVSGQSGLGGEFEGFRHATIDEIRALWTHAGIAEIGTCISLEPVAHLMSLIGCTGNCGSDIVRSSTGYSGSFASASTIYAPGLNQGLARTPPCADAYLTANLGYTTSRFPNFGNWLVRSRAACEDVDVDAIGFRRPLADERFVSGEAVALAASLTSGDHFCEGSELTWSSSRDGRLGTGPSLSVNTLSIGVHELTVAGYGVSATTQVRIFSDLGTFYQAAPAEGEIARIRGDFTIHKVSTTGVDEDWTAYEGLVFDQSSLDPNELVIIARLDVLRHQRFAEPLPFTGGAAIYEHIAKYVHTLHLYLDCRSNACGGGNMYLNRAQSVWGGAYGGPQNPEWCKEPLSALFPPPYKLGLIVHEARHSEPDDPRHTICESGFVGDATLEGGSGYAQAILHAMWVYKYGLYDPPYIKDRAREWARYMLPAYICSPPTHSNPLVQAIVDELLEGYPPSALGKSQPGDPYLEDHACGVGSSEGEP